MPIAPLDLQQLYMQQSHIGRMEHVKMAAKTIAMQSEDRDIHRDSYIKDSTVVKSENISDETKVKEKKDEQRPKDNGYMSYRKKSKKRMADNIDDDEKNNIIEIEEVSATEKTKGSKIDFLG
ncbi:hypothetical protein BFL38_02045 [Brachyspira hampsonii]|uniref:Uncharacterized protein n=1 Tax=Brachyspira hampsonii TaxID=1287055 RepID=A0A1E5NBM2_9SPIR|nr:hypothetical protein [Brachyspira hampsonii]OEJ13552.1 hypothetical protein BFL38_02045 [Brachyspira hampsonii]